MEEHEPTTAGPKPGGQAWCLFQSGSESYGLRLEVVAEVVEIERLVRLPHSPPQVVGLCSLRRDIIPIIRLNEDAAADTHPVGAKLLVLFLRTKKGTWGLRINAEGTIVAEEGLDEISRQVTERTDEPTALVRGDTSYRVIDPERTWQNVRDRVDDWYCHHWTRDRASMTSSLLVPVDAG
jgi:purine-binding chemotaxis protein CheW